METETKKKKKEQEEPIEIGEYIDATSDYGFKRIFKKQKVMIRFLSDFFEKPIKKLTYLNTEKLGTTLEQRATIYDLLCEGEDGTEFIVEMQKREQDYFSDRIVYYLSKHIADQGKKGKYWKYNLKPVYGIFLMKFNLEELPKRRIRKIQLTVDDEFHSVFNNKLKAYVIELPDYKIINDKDCDTELDKWLYNITNMDTLKGELPFAAENEGIALMAEEARVANMSKKERIAYELDLQRERDNYACDQTAKRKAKEEIKKAKAEAMEEGRAEGRAEGFAIVVKRAKSQGKSVEEIVELTGLTPEQIAAL